MGFRYERPGDIVAHCKFTILLLPSGTSRVTGLRLDYNAYKVVSSSTQTTFFLFTPHKYNDATFLSLEQSDKQLDKETKTALVEVEAREAKRKSKKLKKKGKHGGITGKGKEDTWWWW